MVKCPTCKFHNRSVELKPLKPEIGKRYYHFKCSTCYNSFLYVWFIGRGLQEWILESFEPPENRKKPCYDIKEIRENMKECFVTLEIEGYLPSVLRISYCKGRTSYYPTKDVKNVLIPISPIHGHSYELTVYTSLYNGPIILGKFDSMKKLYEYYQEHNLSNVLIAHIL